MNRLIKASLAVILAQVPGLVTADVKCESTGEMMKADNSIRCQGPYPDIRISFKFTSEQYNTPCITGFSGAGCGNAYSPVWEEVDGSGNVVWTQSAYRPMKAQEGKKYQLSLTLLACKSQSSGRVSIGAGHWGKDYCL